MLYIYVKQRKEVRHYENYHALTIHFLNGQNITLNSFLDTGNTLVDPLTKKKIIIIKAACIPFPIKQFLYVPYNTVKEHGLMKCFKIKTVEIAGKISANYLIGLSEKDFLEDGIDCLLNSYCEEDLL